MFFEITRDLTALVTFLNPRRHSNQALIDYCSQSRSRASESTLLSPAQEIYDSLSLVLYSIAV